MSDLIDRQRALDAFDYWVKSPMVGYSNGLLRLHEMLEELPPVTQEPCEDAISRQAVLDGIDTYINKAQSTGTQDDFYSFAELVVKELPPVTPAEKVGQWEWNQYDGNPKIGNFHCSQCHGIGKTYYDYCPSCGTKMSASPTGAESEVQDADSD